MIELKESMWKLLGEKMFPRNVNYSIEFVLSWNVIRLLEIYFYYIYNKMGLKLLHK